MQTKEENRRRLCVGKLKFDSSVLRFVTKTKVVEQVQTRKQFPVFFLLCNRSVSLKLFSYVSKL